MATADIALKPKRLYQSCKHCGGGARGRVCRTCHKDGTARFHDNKPAEPVGSVLNRLRVEHSARFEERIKEVESVGIRAEAKTLQDSSRLTSATLDDLANKLRSAWGAVKHNRRRQT